MKTKERVILSVIVFAMFAGFFASIPILKYLQNVGAETITFINVSAGLVSMLGLSMLALAHSLEVVTDKISAWIFMGMIVLSYLGVICDNLSWAFEGSLQYILLGHILDMGGFLIMPIIMVLLWEYQRHTFFDESQRVRTVRWIVNATAVADVLYIIIGTVTGFLFYIDEYGRYFEGRGFAAVHIFPAIIVACCVYENLRRKTPLKKKLSLLAFGLVPVIAIAFSIPLPQYSIIYVIFFVNLVLVYGTVQVKTELELAEKTARIAEQDKALAEQQTQIMISQIQPHFLYNALASISHLCRKEGAWEAKDAVDHFSDYLRSNMESIRQERLVRFEKELEHVKNYLWLEQMRFGDDLKVEYRIEAADFLLPPLTVQPLVENAVKHGICGREGGGSVWVESRTDGGTVEILIRDDGVGFDADERENDGKIHVGIENVRSRLELLCGGRLDVESVPGEGTCARITLPAAQTEREQTRREQAT